MTVATEKPKALKKEPILEMKDIRYSPSLLGGDLSICRGELVTILVPRFMDCRPLGSKIQGLQSIVEGTVRFEGRAWTGNSYQLYDEMRHRIGRVFEGTGWVENLSLYENIIIAQRHHEPTQSVDSIEKEILALAKQFRMDSIEKLLDSDIRPSKVGKTDLKICEWIRAFLGKPKFLLFEHPMKSVPATYRNHLINRLEHDIGKGVSCLWFTLDRNVQEHDYGVAVRHYRIANQELREVG